MKYILHIIAKLDIGGAEKVARDIGYYADPAEYECHYVVFGNEVGEYEAELTERGCRIFHLPAPSKGYLRYIRNLKALMRRYPYHAVHAHTMFNAGWAMLVARQMKVPVRIAHAHSVLDNGSNAIKTAYEAGMRFLILRNATHLVACGAAAGERLFGPKAYEKRGTLILNGISTTKFAFDAQKRSALRKAMGLEDMFVIGHVGHLSPEKNQSFILSLMPEVLKMKENARVYLLGDGPERSRLKDKVQALELGDAVVLTGNVPNVYDYLCVMDVFVFPSLYEGMPLSIIEVQANGLPCILSDRVPKDVYLTDLLTVLPLEEPQAWIPAICSAQRCRPEDYAQDIRRRGFDTDTVVRKFYDIYAVS